MQEPLIFCIFSQSNILKISVNHEKLREVLRPFSLLHQTIGMIYYFWVEYQEVLRPFSLSQFERSIRAQEPLSKNERSINASQNIYKGNTSLKMCV